MQNLFSMLSRTLARLSGDTAPQETVRLLISRVDRLEKQNKQFKKYIEKIDLLSDHVLKLQTAVSELNTISNILLSVQQQLLEEFIYPHTSSSSKKGSSLMMFSLPPSDDDDLPN